MVLSSLSSSIYSLGQSFKSKLVNGCRYESVIRSSPDFLEKYHELPDGYHVPIFQHYRYSIKPSCGEFKPIALLKYLDELDLLSASESSLLKQSIGSRRLEGNLDELEDVCLQVCPNHLDLFSLSSDDTSTVDSFHPKINPQVLFSKIKSYKSMHRKEIANINRVSNYNLRPGSKVLEIGFETGGVSIFAFEELGFEVFGIDNNHDGLVSSSIHNTNLNNKYHSGDSTFVVGDITQRTVFDDNYFDLIYSVSVLEHINNLDKAFLEMKRILKPGGLIVHNYGPYFSHSGGHALGIPDSPWGHVCMSHDDYLRYISLERSNEYPQASGWLSNAVHRDDSRTIKSVQSKIFSNGFDLLYWSSQHSPHAYLNHLTPDLVNRAFLVNPFLSFDDLITVANLFIARAL